MQKIGGIAAILEAIAYIVGFAVMLTILVPDNADSLSPAQRFAFLLDKQAVVVAWNLVIYVFFGIFLVVLALALHERLKSGAEALTNVATAFGLIWAGLVIAAGMIANVGLGAAAKVHMVDPVQATALWQSITAIQDGIGGGVELVGGMWVLLVSIAAMRQARLPAFLNYLGMAIGVTGILTVLPDLKELGAVFGLGQIVWFAWLGVVMLRSRPPQGHPATTGASPRP
jgi:hypothetical protein